jgi:hypothetical protein
VLRLWKDAWKDLQPGNEIAEAEARTAAKRTRQIQAASKMIHTEMKSVFNLEALGGV